MGKFIYYICTNLEEMEERARSPRKQCETCMYEKKQAIPQKQSSILYPLGSEQIMFSRQTSAEDRGKIMKKATQTKASFVPKQNDFSAVEEEKQLNKNLVLKKLIKSPYDLEQMHSIYKGTKDKWTDPDFNYENIRLGSNPVVWKRPQQIVDNPALFPENIQPSDVVQGWLNDCYFLSAVACLTERPHRIHSIFQTKEYNPNGYYVCKMTWNGRYQEIIVDDLFPVLGGPNNNKPVYAKPAQGRYIWVMVLQKCWAKLLQGYSRTNFGYTSEAFQALTGAPTIFRSVNSFRTAQDMYSLRLFNILKRSDEKQFVTQVSVRGFQNDRRKKNIYENEYGLPTAHAYSLLGVYETKLKSGQVVKLVQIRNPWGDKESKLMWNDKDPIWNEVVDSQKERMLFQFNKNPYDGVFYMNWQTFVRRFDNILSICQIDDRANYVFADTTIRYRQPKFFQIKTDGEPDDLSIVFAQKMELHFIQQVQYANMTALISRIVEGEKGERSFEYFWAANYYSQEVDNYFTLPFRKLPKGKYMLRLLAIEPTPSQKQATIVAGVYSPAGIGLRQDTSVDDMQFMTQICIQKAQEVPQRIKYPGDWDSWIVRALLPNSSIGYVMFNASQKSPYSSFQIIFDERRNQKLQFLLDHSHQKQFVVECPRGQQKLVFFRVIVSQNSHLSIFSRPDFKIDYQLPAPKITHS